MTITVLCPIEASRPADANGDDYRASAHLVGIRCSSGLARGAGGLLATGRRRQAGPTVTFPRLLPPCYHAWVTSAKKQTQIRLEEDTLEAGKAAARARGLDFNRYVERLIIEDTTGARAAGMAAAQRLIDEHGSYLDDLEQQLDAPYADSQPGVAA